MVKHKYNHILGTRQPHIAGNNVWETYQQH